MRESESMVPEMKAGREYRHSERTLFFYVLTPSTSMQTPIHILSIFYIQCPLGDRKD